MAGKESKRVILGLVVVGLSVLFALILFTTIQYASIAGFHGILEIFQNFPAEEYIGPAAFANIMLFASSFVLTIAFLALLTHGAIFKAAKKLIAGYFAFVAAMFAVTGVAGVMIALIISIFSLLVLYQFALKNVILRAPVSGPEEIVGSDGIVVDEIEEDEQGRVKVGDSIWWALSSDGSTIGKGEKVKVVGASSQNLVLKVRRMPSKRVASATQRDCPYCGKGIDRDSTFCPNCGSALD